MFNQTIKKNIEDTIIQLEKEMNFKDSQEEFIRLFLSNNSFQGINSVDNIDLIDLFIARFISVCENKKISYEEIKDITYRNSIVFTELNSPTFNSLFNVISYVATEVDLDELYNFFKHEGKMSFDFKNLFAAKEKYASIMTLSNFEKKHNCDILSLVKLTKQFYYETRTAISLVHAAIELKEIVEMYKDDLSLYKDILNIKMSERNSSKAIKENIKSDYDISTYETEMVNLRDYCVETINKEEARQRELRKQINNYRVIQTWMDKLDSQKRESKTAISIDPSVMRITSDSIRLDILKTIYLENLKTAQELKEIHQNLSENSTNHYKKLLKKYNIVLSEDEISFNMSVNDLENALGILKKVNITDPKTLLKITQSSSLETITDLCSYINRGLLNTKFILENIDLFSNSHKLSSLKENIEYLQEEKISTTYIQKMRDVLLEKPDLLRKNILVLKEHSLLKFYKKAKSYHFLQAIDLEDKVDIMLELGYEKNLEENLDLLNYTKDDYKRLEVLKRLNIPLNNTEEIEKVLNNSNFIISNDDLDNYISDFSNYPILDGEEISKTKWMEKLDINQDENSTSRVYSFQGLLISKNKIKKEMATIDKETLTVSDQFQCLTKNKLLSQEDYFKIKNLISSNKVSDTVKIKK